MTNLFDPIAIGKLELRNRIVMSPMTRGFCPDGAPTQAVIDYYRRRAAAEVGLIVTEGTWVDHPGAWEDPDVPNFYGADAEAGWKKVVDAVHAEQGAIIPQLWHVGAYYTTPIEGFREQEGKLRPEQIGPSGMAGGMGRMPSLMGRPATDAEIDEMVDAFVRGGVTAWKLGFDGVALHGAHGYLIDQFFWEVTNLRSDQYGGGIAERTRFATEIIKGIRAQTAPDFPIMFRWSQWKSQNYDARLVQSPKELELFLAPLVDAGVDIFDCSQRRFWEPAFDVDDHNLASWTKRVTGKPVMTVGSVGLDSELFASLTSGPSRPMDLDALKALLDRGDFDLVGVGRALLADPEWVLKVRQDRWAEMISFSPGSLGNLV
jgi:2,4-dienoyl-CoA reductase-like NADH-dependent reductase (Old Yellow Enzyme family)